MQSALTEFERQQIIEQAKDRCFSFHRHKAGAADQYQLFGEIDAMTVFSLRCTVAGGIGLEGSADR